MIDIISWATPWGPHSAFLCLGIWKWNQRLILESGSVGIASDDERAERRKADEDLAIRIEDHDGAWFATRWAEAPIFESQKQLSEGVEELIYLRRSNNSTYALACTLRGSGQGVMPYVGDKLEKFSVEGLYVSGRIRYKIYYNRKRCIWQVAKL